MLRRVILLMSVALATVTISFAQTITSTGSFGNWNDTSTWDGGVVPTSGDNVIIAAGDIVTVDATAPWGGGHCLPRGTLREPVRALRRAHAVVLTRTDLVSQERRDHITDQIRRIAPP